MVLYKRKISSALICLAWKIQQKEQIQDKFALSLTPSTTLFIREFAKLDPGANALTYFVQCR